MTRTNQHFVPTLLIMLATACATPTAEGGSVSDDTGGGKADEAGGAAFRSVEMIGYHSEGGESEGFDLWVEPSGAFASHVVRGTRVNVSIYADDGASNPDYRIEGTVTRGVDGMMTDAPLDTSSLLPHLRLAAHFWGTTASGFVVDETWVFDDGQSLAHPAADYATPSSVFGGVSTFNADIGPESGSISLLAELSDAQYGNAHDGDAIRVELWADDVGWNIVSDSLVYEVDGVGAYASGAIDVSALLPFRAMFARLSGTLSTGKTFSETWFVEGGSTEAELLQISATFHGISLQQTGDGFDREGILLIANLENGYHANDGDTLAVEVWAADGNVDYRVAGVLEYAQEGYAAFRNAAVIDTSSLLPWRALRVRTFGELSSGASIDQTFEFDAETLQGAPVTR